MKIALVFIQFLLILGVSIRVSCAPSENYESKDVSYPDFTNLTDEDTRVWSASGSVSSRSDEVDDDDGGVHLPLPGFQDKVAKFLKEFSTEQSSHAPPVRFATRQSEEESTKSLEDFISFLEAEDADEQGLVTFLAKSRTAGLRSGDGKQDAAGGESENENERGVFADCDGDVVKKTHKSLPPSIIDVPTNCPEGEKPDHAGKCRPVW